MSSGKQYTVDDIVAEMRMLNPETFLVSKWCRAPMPNKTRSYADRIEEAHKCEVARLQDDNARLMAALKPVLECRVVSDVFALRGLCLKQLSEIVSEAQRVYDNWRKTRLDNEGVK